MNDLELAGTGQEGLYVDVTCPRENAPENLHMLLLLERICAVQTEMLQRVGRQGNATV